MDFASVWQVDQISYRSYIGRLLVFSYISNYIIFYDELYIFYVNPEGLHKNTKMNIDQCYQEDDIIAQETRKHLSF